MDDVRVYPFCDSSDKFVLLKGEVFVHTETEIERHSIWRGDSIAQGKDRYRRREQPGFHFANVVKAIVSLASLS